MEIECKYLVRLLPENLEQYPHIEIEQGYISTSPTLRIRRAGESFILTVKEHISTDGVIVNREEEFAITQEAYNHLKSKCDGIFVAKTRYKIPLQDNLIAELDIFHGVHEGLVLVEVEFPSIQSSIDFVAPDWFGENVSNNPNYRNAALAQRQ